MRIRMPTWRSSEIPPPGLGAEAIVTTAKDLARLDQAGSTPDLYVLEIELEIEDSSSFGSVIFQSDRRIDQAVAAHQEADQAHRPHHVLVHVQGCRGC